MSSSLTDRMRAKYAPRTFGRYALFERTPPGGADVHELCNAVDRLHALIELLQSEAPADRQNNAQRILWEVLS